MKSVYRPHDGARTDANDSITAAWMPNPSWGIVEWGTECDVGFEYGCAR